MGTEGVVRRRGVVVAAAVAAILTAVAGCGAGGLQFRNDHRLQLVRPEPQTRVSLPFTVEWTMTGFEPVGLDGSSRDGAGIFAVFVDRAPMPAGADLRSVVPELRGCEGDPSCPTPEQLAERDVYLTTGTSLTIERLPRAQGRVGDEQHYVNIVLLDGTGRRIGESAWYLPFTTERRSS